MQHEFIIHDKIIQGSEEWKALRLGKITGSEFKDLNGTKAAREKYLYKKATEIMLRCPSDQDEFSRIGNSVHVQRGWLHEELAADHYLADKLKYVRIVGLVELNKHLACSPDGLIDNDGMIEIKNIDSPLYTKQVIKAKKEGIRKVIDEDHFYQIQFNLYICDRQWCDYVLHNYKHHDVKKNGYSCYRIERDEEVQKEIKTILDDAILEIQYIIRMYNDVFNIT